VRDGPTKAPARIALLGTGTVGRAVLARLAAWEGTSFGGHLSLAYVANSREAFHLSPFPIGRGVGVRGDRSDGISAAHASHPSRHHVRTRVFGQLLPTDEGHPVASDLANVSRVLEDASTRIVIDATASDAVADRHAHWLAQGIHVVTACKLGGGTALARWRAIRAACTRGGTSYGDGATVGAGLPLLRTLRELQAGLFHHYDGMRPFSALARQARDAGYTEPDPRDDLSGEDVRRKLLILARAAGLPLEAGEVDVESLVSPALAAVAVCDVDGALDTLDAPLRARYAAAWKDGARLRFIARLDSRGTRQRARVGVEALAADDPLAGGAGTDNRVAIWSDRYARQPLVIQGPGAGAEVTAAALLDDALRIAG
jgi:homoserine dehydrogenase